MKKYSFLKFCRNKVCHSCWFQFSFWKTEISMYSDQYLYTQYAEKLWRTYWVPNTFYLKLYIFDKSNEIVIKSSLNFLVNKGMYLLYSLLLKDWTTTVTLIHCSGSILLWISWNLENKCLSDALMCQFQHYRQHLWLSPHYVKNRTMVLLYGISEIQNYDCLRYMPLFSKSSKLI